MISSGVVVYVFCQPVDFRKGAASLMAVVRDGGLDPFNGALYVFRSKRADRIRIVWWDGSGVCLYSKMLEDRGEDTSGPFPAHGFVGRNGLEKDPPEQDKTPFADGVIALRQDDS